MPVERMPAGERETPKLYKPLQIDLIWKRKPVKQHQSEPSWTRWKRGQAHIVSMRLDRIYAELAQSSVLERCEDTFHRYAVKMGFPVVTVTTSLFYNPKSPEKEPVGANILKDGTVTLCRHNKPRKYAVFPSARTKAHIRRIDSWEEVLGIATETPIRAIELGPTIYPKPGAGLNEPDWLNRRTRRYVLAFRGNNELLVIYHPKASPIDLWWLCYKLKVKTADLLDGGSSIRDGSWHHAVFMLRSSPA